MRLPETNLSLQEVVAAHKLDGFEDVFWNVGQVVAWVQTRSPFPVDALSDSTRELAERDHSMPSGLPHFAADVADECADEAGLPRTARPFNSIDEVRRAVVRSFQAGAMTASGQRELWLIREPIPTLEWADLTMDDSVNGEMIVRHREGHAAAWLNVRVHREEVMRAFPPVSANVSPRPRAFPTPPGHYPLEKAVLLIAKELDSSIWQTAGMTAEEIVAYEGLGQTTHYNFLGSILENIALNLRDRKGNQPDDGIAQRLASYERCRGLVRGALSKGDLRSFVLFAEGEPTELASEVWDQDLVVDWFDDGRIWFDDLEGRSVAAWACILIDKDSFSDWYYSASGPMAGVEANERDKGGRPKEYDWDAIKEFALGLVSQHGKPGRGNKVLPSKTQLAEAILNEWAKKGIELADPTVRRYVGQWLREL